jgi:hypothetical protein
MAMLRAWHMLAPALALALSCSEAVTQPVDDAALDAGGEDAMDVSEPERSDAGVGARADAEASPMAEAGCPSGCPHEIQGYCSELPLSPLQDFESTLAVWREKPCSWFRVEGSCASGGKVLYSGTGLSIERRFFDSEGRFEALQTGTDATPPGCGRPWPNPISCGEAVISQVICGTRLQVGEVIRY